VKIQAFLDQIPYSAENANRCPVSVLRDEVAHCLDGALFAAAALRQLGHPPRVIDLLPEPGRDDDHVLAIYMRNGHYGAIAKSNFVGLRFREPVYRSLRELVMSYFEMYFNTRGTKSLLSYSRPVNLARFDCRAWMTSEDDLDYIGDYLGTILHTPVLGRADRRRLSPADPEVVRACFLGSKESGLFKPR